MAVFVSNVPEGLSSAAGMRRAGRSPSYVFGLWTGIALISGLAAVVGYALWGGVSPMVLAAVTAVAGGAVLTMVADTMIPEAFDEAHLAGSPRRVRRGPPGWWPGRDPRRRVSPCPLRGR